ncbi:MAG: YncE family protein [Acidobacteriales bacterium]|nr:YncE family protein [Terriglobales bacterium]
MSVAVRSTRFAAILALFAILSLAPSAHASKVVASINVGGDSSIMALNPNTHLLYAGNLNGYVSVIDTQTSTVVATVPTGSVFGVAVNTETNTIYANTGGDGVYVIDGATNTVTDVITSGEGEAGIAVDENLNQIYAANKNDSTLSVIDGSTDQVVATVPIGGVLARVAVDSRIQRVFVTVELPGTVVAVDTVSHTVAGSLVLSGALLNGMVVDEGLQRVYVTDNYGFVVDVIDPAQLSLTDTVPGFQYPYNLALDRRTHTFYVVGANTFVQGQVTAVSARTLELGGHANFRMGLPTSAAVDVSTGYLYVTHGDRIEVLRTR